MWELISIAVQDTTVEIAAAFVLGTASLAVMSSTIRGTASRWLWRKTETLPPDAETAAASEETPVGGVEETLAHSAPFDPGVPAVNKFLEFDLSVSGQDVAFAPESTVRDLDLEGPPAGGQRSSWWARLREGLSRSSGSIGEGLSAIFTKRKLDAEMLEELEDVLIRADLGVATAARISKAIGASRYDKDVGVEEVKAVLATEIERVLTPYARPLEIDRGKTPFVILVVGVNGSGKTTTIGKLTAKLKTQGMSVILAAGDTFRAAAIEQLRIWGERLDCPIIAHEQGGDASALAFDAIKAARDCGAGVMLMDTAGTAAKPRRAHGRTRENHPCHEKNRSRRTACSAARP